MFSLILLAIFAPRSRFISVNSLVEQKKTHLLSRRGEQTQPNLTNPSSSLLQRGEETEGKYLHFSP
jgi:hypothetical protein